MWSLSTLLLAAQAVTVTNPLIALNSIPINQRADKPHNHITYTLTIYLFNV